MNRISTSRDTVLKWELLGTGFICVVGSLFHFTFEWVGRWHPAALLFAVNESVWEHLKLAFWPGLLFSLVEYPFIKKMAHNFWLAKTAGLLTMPLTIVALFYGYTAILGHHFLWIDISIFVVAVFMGQLTSYRLMTVPKKRSPAKRMALVLLAIMVTAFSTFTYHPPRISLFEDPATQEYGIIDAHPKR